MNVEVPRVEHIEDEEFRRQFADRGLPVIIAGCIDHWPGSHKWDLDYFERRFGEKRVRFSGKEWMISDVCRELRTSKQPAPYLNQVKLDEQFPELIPDLGALRYTRSNRLRRWARLLPASQRVSRGIKALFIGGTGSGFGKLHWDFSYLHVYISQVRGSKDFVIFPPSDSQYLYPNPDYPADSLIKDFNNFSVGDFPNVKKASPIRFTVREGETVFLPGGWWHSTKMNGVSISIAESALDRANWGMRREFFAKDMRAAGHPSWKVALYKRYISALGHFAGTFEMAS